MLFYKVLIGLIINISIIMGGPMGPQWGPRSPPQFFLRSEKFCGTLVLFDTADPTILAKNHLSKNGKKTFFFLKKA